MWTCIAGTITSFTKYVVQAFPDGRFHRGDRERILGYLVAFPVTLKRQLRGEKDLRELKDVLSVEDLAELQNTPDMPSHCLYILSGYCLHAKAAESELPQTFIVVCYISFLKPWTMSAKCQLQLSNSVSVRQTRSI